MRVRLLRPSIHLEQRLDELNTYLRMKLRPFRALYFPFYFIPSYTQYPSILTFHLHLHLPLSVHASIHLLSRFIHSSPSPSRYIFSSGRHDAKGIIASHIYIYTTFRFCFLFLCSFHRLLRGAA
ncbi:hypothetical protein K438DRAFT_1798248 [Mycena galopus ATCC 62051]|nr:hypothetical protein K438DRAFT_1798248 [Mycena galopus ATCC 62051]